MKTTTILSLLMITISSYSCKPSIASNTMQKDISKLSQITSNLDLAIYHDQVVKLFNDFATKFRDMQLIHRELTQAGHNNINLLNNYNWKNDANKALNALDVSANKLTTLPQQSPLSVVMNVRLNKLHFAVDSFIDSYKFMMDNQAINLKSTLDDMNDVVFCAGNVGKQVNYLSDLIEGKLKLSSHPPAGTLIAFHINDKLYVQPPMRMDTYIATVSQNAMWKARNKPVSLISSDGLYRFVLTSSNSDNCSYKIVSVKGNKVVITSKALKGSVYYATISCFDGWIPGTHAFRMIYTFHSSSGEEYHWPIINIDKRCVVPFNGWLSSDHKWAIVPNANGVGTDSEDHDHPDRISSPGKRYMYVVHMTTDINHYRFHYQSAKKIIIDGGWTLFPSGLIADDYPNSKIGVHKSSIVFSRDSHYAICGGDILINLHTAKATKLPGDDATFIE